MSRSKPFLPLRHALAQSLITELFPMMILSANIRLPFNTSTFSTFPCPFCQVLDCTLKKNLESFLFHIITISIRLV